MAEAGKLRNGSERVLAPGNGGRTAAARAIGRQISRNRANTTAAQAAPPRFETPDHSIRLTPQEEEREIRANERNGWGFSRATATSQLERYFNGDARTKVKVYSRFEDANFHGLNRALESGDPVKLRDWMNQTYDDVKPSKKEKELYRRLGLNVR